MMKEDSSFQRINIRYFLGGQHSLPQLEAAHDKVTADQCNDFAALCLHLLIQRIGLDEYFVVPRVKAVCQALVEPPRSEYMARQNLVRNQAVQSVKINGAVCGRV
jgi:hypothetical protein